MLTEVTSLINEIKAEPKPIRVLIPGQNGSYLELKDEDKHRGLYLIKSKKVKDEWLEEEIKLTKAFKIISRVRGFNSDSEGLRLEWVNGDGLPMQQTVFKRDLDQQNFCRSLLDRGFPAILTDAMVKGNFLTFLCGATSKKKEFSVDRIGWHGDIFCLPNKSYGPVDERIYFTDDTLTKYNQAGTLEEWQTNIARYAQGNTALTFALATAAAGPLLPIFNTQGRGIHTSGKSSKGKTTAGKVAGSMWGGPKFIETWSTTSNALEAAAAGHSDALLVLDELGQADPKMVATAVYNLSNGAGKQRMRSDVTMRQKKEWSIVYLSNGEDTIAKKLREANIKIKAGQEVRCIDIPVIDFENSHNFADNYTMAIHLLASTEKYYGTAADAYLSMLVKRTPENEAEWRLWKEAWIQTNTPEGASSQVRRVIEFLGVVALGGELLSRWGISTLTSKDNDTAIINVLKAWLGERGEVTDSGEDMKALEFLSDFIERYPGKFIAPYDTAKVGSNEVYGWHRAVYEEDNLWKARVAELVKQGKTEDAPEAQRQIIETKYWLTTDGFERIYQDLNLKATKETLFLKGVLQSMKSIPRKINGKSHKVLIINYEVLQACLGATAEATFEDEVWEELDQSKLKDL